MKGSSLLALIAPAIVAAQAPHAAEHHTFVMDKFTFESGATVPNVRSSTARTVISMRRATTSCCCRRTTWRTITATSG